MSTSNVHCLSWLFTSQIFVPGGSIGKNKESLLIIAQYLFCSLQPFSHLSIIILAIFYCNCAFLSGAFLILNVNSSREISLQLGCLCEESMNKLSSREGEENPPDQSNRMVPRELHGRSWWQWVSVTLSLHGGYLFAKYQSGEASYWLFLSASAVVGCGHCPATIIPQGREAWSCTWWHTSVIPALGSTGRRVLRKRPECTIERDLGAK